MKKRERALSATLSIWVVILLAVFGLIADYIGYTQFTESLTGQYQNNAVAIAREASSMISVADLEAAEESAEGEAALEQISKNLKTFCEEMEAEFIYIIRVDESDYGEIEFLFEVVSKNSPFMPLEKGHKQPTTNDEYRQKYRELYEGKRTHAVVVRDKGAVKTGHHITALFPMRGESGKVQALLAVQKQMDFLSSGRLNYLRSIILATVILILLAGGCSVLLLRRHLLKPIWAIGDEAERFAQKNTLPEQPLAETVRSRDELGVLAATIDEMERQTLDYFGEMNRVNAEKERVDSELYLATQIQQHMLPLTFPPFPDRSEFDLFARMDPAREVGGDFYDFYLIDETHLAVIVADVSGKGIPGALFMACTKMLIKNTAQMKLPPDEVFTRANRALCENNTISLFVTAWMGILDLETGKLTYVNAGHNAPLVMTPDGEFTYLRKRTGFVLAGLEDSVYRAEELTLKPGSRLFLYTDGVTEATTAENELYGEERLRDYLNRHSEEKVQPLLNGLRGDIEAFVGDVEQFDDITMLILDYKKGVEQE